MSDRDDQKRELENTWDNLESQNSKRQKLLSSPPPSSPPLAQYSESESPPFTPIFNGIRNSSADINDDSHLTEDGTTSGEVEETIDLKNNLILSPSHEPENASKSPQKASSGSSDTSEYPSDAERGVSIVDDKDQLDESEESGKSVKSEQSDSSVMLGEPGETDESDKSDESSESDETDSSGESDGKSPKRKKSQLEYIDFCKLYKNPTIYSSANLEVLSAGKLEFERGTHIEGDSMYVNNSEVPKLRPEFKEMNRFKEPTGINQVYYKPPDEILTDKYGFEPNELVYLSREDIQRHTKVELPGEEIANAIHYYVAERIRTSLGISDEEYNANYAKIFDGSALLALSALVTKWVEDSCGDSTFKSYMEKVKTKKMSSIEKFIRVHDDSASSESSDEEIMHSTRGDEKNRPFSKHAEQSRRQNFRASSTNSGSETEEEIRPVNIGTKNGNVY